ncbi:MULTISPECIES: sulfite exporter TauE/SafE family protein [unclassified Corynebacterium]|uniref:sulfite exporter TauE/SafE family protein n=1 Tax=unclassified Corynebacterium TaxID=2624378 RepID=UPI0008A3FBF7|nr:MULTISPECIES: sulfite exporter TauE/SafE family protein [unclassified Corynebacterium]OFP35561.1 permease [Corynebacterium sp. HMSC071B10]OHF38630.1 permease [Corynebacterium sp. HMSC074A01]
MYKLSTLTLIAFAGLAAQLVDGGLGMGFGATSTTILVMLAGLGPAAASAVVHTAELGTTLASGVAHWRFGNVDWKVVAAIGVPGAVGSFVGATVLARLSTEAAQPVMSLILALIGLNLMIRFSRGLTQRKLAAKPHSKQFLGGLGLFGGFVDATGGGGWGPVTTSTLLAAGRSEPRRIVGTVNTAEFLVTAAATLGFAIGMWHDLVANLAAVAALLVGGVIAAPIGAWLVSRLNPVLLGGVVGTLIVFLNLPKVLDALGVPGDGLWAARVAVLVVGVLLSWRGVQRARTSQAKTPGPVSEDPQRRTTKVHAA